MNCTEARDNLIDLLYGELDPPRRQGIEEHLAGCPACREELAKLRLARAVLARGRSAEPPATRVVIPALTGRAGGKRRFVGALPLRRAMIGASAVAAAVAVAALLWAS